LRQLKPRRNSKLNDCAILVALALLAGLLLLAALLTVHPAPRTDNVHYVLPTGSDSASGSSSQPWRTIQHAADVMASGGTVIVLAGDYPERVLVTRSGASGSPITFKAQGPVTMRGFTVEADYIALIGFDISNTADNWRDGWGIFLEGSNCTIEDNYVHFATRGGIAVWAAPGNYGNTSHCVVKNNRLYRNATAGIEVYGQDNLIEENEIWGTIQHHPLQATPPVGADADGMRFFGSGHTFRGNYIHDISLQDPENVNPHIDCFQTWSSSGYEPAHDVIFEQNRCENLNVGMYAFMLQGARDLTIRNNIIQAFAGVNTGGGGNRDLTIVNNVFAGDLSFSPDQHPAGIELENAPNVVVKNNVFYNFASHIIYTTGNSDQGLDVGYNCAYRSDGEAVSDSPYPHDLWNVDPNFVDPTASNFHLRGNSPLIDAGTNLSIVPDDYDGTHRPQGSAYDIGAFEKTP